MFEGKVDANQVLETERIIDYSLANAHGKFTGIQALIDSNKAYECLPKIKLVYKNLLNVLSLNMTHLVETRVELSMLSLSSLTFGQYVELTMPSSLMIIFSNKQWQSYGLFTVNNSLITTLVDLLPTNKKLKKKPYKSLHTSEHTCLHLLSNIVMDSLSESFNFIDQVSFKYERVETDPRFVAVCREEDKVLLAKIIVNIEGRKGIIDILLPYQGFDSIKPLLLNMNDPINDSYNWYHSLKTHIKNIELTLNVVLRSSNYSLEDVLHLKTGSILIMDTLADQDVDMIASGQKILTGKIGSYGNRMAIFINNVMHNINQSERIK